MEQGRRQSRIRPAFRNCRIEILFFPGSSGCNHGYADRIGYGPRERKVISRFCSVSVHGGEQDLTGTKGYDALCPFNGVDSGILPAALDIEIPSVSRCAPLCVYGNDDALVSEFHRSLGNEFRILYGSRIHGYFVRPFP